MLFIKDTQPEDGIPEGNQQSSSREKHNYPIPTSEELALKSPMPDGKPQPVAPVDYEEAIQEYIHDGTRSS